MSAFEKFDETARRLDTKPADSPQMAILREMVRFGPIMGVDEPGPLTLFDIRRTYKRMRELGIPMETKALAADGGYLPIEACYVLRISGDQECEALDLPGAVPAIKYSDRIRKLKGEVCAVECVRIVIGAGKELEIA